MIENERKFVLLNECCLEKQASKLSSQVISIQQSYFSGSPTVRIRKSSIKKKDIFTLTVKQKVDSKTVEIEKKISKNDYDLLSKKTSSWLNKKRYLIEGWEIDFFKSDKTYFIMAEIELHPNQIYVPSIHPFVKENLVFSVPQSDCRFSSKKLADELYATSLYSSLLQTKTNVL